MTPEMAHYCTNPACQLCRHCDYCDTFEGEGLMVPTHDCPAPAPDEFDDLGAPLTDLEHQLLASLNFAIGTAEGVIVDRRRWT